jgi:N-acyl-D-aspartate/D-glutamate deacylase
VLQKNRGLRGRHIAEIAKERGLHPLDAFLDLAVKENPETVFSLGEINMDTEAVAQILGSPYAVVGLSDGGAHVQFHSNVSNPTRLLGYWVREKGIMSLELAVRRLTFDSASAFGIYDRGLIQPGMAADLVVFDPDTVRPSRKTRCTSRAAAMRERPRAFTTVVNGEVLMEKGHRQPPGGAAQRQRPGALAPFGKRAPSPPSGGLDGWGRRPLSVHASFTLSASSRPESVPLPGRGGQRRRARRSPSGAHRPPPETMRPSAMSR